MSEAAGRQLFVYWKTGRAAAAKAAAAAAAMQAGLQRDHPGLSVALYRRSEEGSEHRREAGREDADDQVTLMEVYSRAGGVDTALQRAIESAAEQQLAPHLRGVRHTEVFTAL